jgi:hypothetical protein
MTTFCPYNTTIQNIKTFILFSNIKLIISLFQVEFYPCVKKSRVLSYHIAFCYTLKFLSLKLICLYKKNYQREELNSHPKIIFQGEIKDIENVFLSIKLTSWSWISSYFPNINNYSFASWCNNLISCLQMC